MEFSDLCRRLLHVVPGSYDPVEPSILAHYKYHKDKGDEMTVGPTVWYVGQTKFIADKELLDSATVDGCLHVCCACCCGCGGGCCKHRCDEHQASVFDPNL